MEDPKEIARKLTNAQREAVKKAYAEGHGMYVFGTKPFRNRLAKLHVCLGDQRAGRGGAWLTPLGLAVREALLTPTREDQSYD